MASHSWQHDISKGKHVARSAFRAGNTRLSQRACVWRAKKAEAGKAYSLVTSEKMSHSGANLLQQHSGKQGQGIRVPCWRMVSNTHVDFEALQQRCSTLVWGAVSVQSFHQHGHVLQPAHCHCFHVNRHGMASYAGGLHASNSHGIGEGKIHHLVQRLA